MRAHRTQAAPTVLVIHGFTGTPSGGAHRPRHARQCRRHRCRLSGGTPAGSRRRMFRDIERRRRCRGDRRDDRRDRRNGAQHGPRSNHDHRGVQRRRHRLLSAALCARQDLPRQAPFVRLWWSSTTVCCYAAPGSARPTRRSRSTRRRRSTAATASAASVVRRGRPVARLHRHRPHAPGHRAGRVRRPAGCGGRARTVRRRRGGAGSASATSTPSAPKPQPARPI